MDIIFRSDKNVNYEDLITLFNQAGWHDKTIEIERLESMVSNSQVVITAWDYNVMIGFARCVTDFVYNGQINNVVVHNDFKNQGIGKELIKMILNTSEYVTYILRGDSHNKDFYESLGFTNNNLTFTYERKK